MLLLIAVPDGAREMRTVAAAQWQYSGSAVGVQRWCNTTVALSADLANWQCIGRRVRQEVGTASWRNLVVASIVYSGSTLALPNVVQ
jgi:hypothetical protein